MWGVGTHTGILGQLHAPLILLFQSLEVCDLGTFNTVAGLCHLHRLVPSFAPPSRPVWALHASSPASGPASTLPPRHLRSAQ